MYMRTNVCRKIETAQKKKHNLITCDQPFDRQIYLHYDVSSMTEIGIFLINQVNLRFSLIKTLIKTILDFLNFISNIS